MNKIARCGASLKSQHLWSCGRRTENSSQPKLESKATSQNKTTWWLPWQRCYSNAVQRPTPVGELLLSGLQQNKLVTKVNQLIILTSIVIIPPLSGKFYILRNTEHSQGHVMQPCLITEGQVEPSVTQTLQNTALQDTENRISHKSLISIAPLYIEWLWSLARLKERKIRFSLKEKKKALASPVSLSMLACPLSEASCSFPSVSESHSACCPYCSFSAVFSPNNNLAAMMTAEVRKEPFQKGSIIEIESQNFLWENNEEK